MASSLDREAKVDWKLFYLNFSFFATSKILLAFCQVDGMLRSVC